MLGLSLSVCLGGALLLATCRGPHLPPLSAAYPLTSSGVAAAWLGLFLLLCHNMRVQVVPYVPVSECPALGLSSVSGAPRDQESPPLSGAADPAGTPDARRPCSAGAVVCCAAVGLVLPGGRRRPLRGCDRALPRALHLARRCLLPTVVRSAGQGAPEPVASPPPVPVGGCCGMQGGTL